MFCPQCGTVLPDQASFCSACGANLSATPIESAMPQSYEQYPVNEAPTAQQPFHFSGDEFKAAVQEKWSASKDFLSKFNPNAGGEGEGSAPKTLFGLSGNRLIAMILAIVCVLTLVISYFSVLNKSIERIPIVSWILGDVADEIKDSRKEAKDMIEELEEELEDVEDDLSKKELKVAKKALKSIKQLTKAYSINNIKSCAKVMEEVADEDIEGIGFGSVMGSALDGLDVALNIISLPILISMLLSLVFSACGGFLKIKGLVITGMIFSIIYGLVFCGFIFLLLLIAAHVALYIFLGKVKAEANAAAMAQ